MTDPVTQAERLAAGVSSEPARSAATACADAASLAGAALELLAEVERDPMQPLSAEAWSALEGTVTEVLQRLQELFEAIARRFERARSETEDLLDLDLALALDDPEEGPPSPIRDRYELRLGRLFDAVEPGRPATAGPCVAEIATLLARAAAEHRSRLARTRLTTDPRALEIELAELRTKFRAGLQSLQAAVLRGLTETPLSELVPELPTPSARLPRLRRWAIALDRALREVDREAPPETQRLAVIERLDRAAQAEEASWLRPHDGAELNGFRRWARDDRSPAAEELEARVERLLAWSSSMLRINDREPLRRQDAHYVDIALDMLSQGMEGSALLVVLADLRGRSPALDALIERLWVGDKPPKTELSAVLREVARDLDPRRSRR